MLERLFAMTGCALCVFAVMSGCGSSTTNGTDAGTTHDASIGMVDAAHVAGDAGPTADAFVVPVDSGTAVDAGAHDAGPPGDAGPPFDSGLTTHVPTNHRPAPVACTHTRGPGSGRPETPGECMVDTDCTTGMNGRCVQSSGGALLNHCSYDDCYADGDCGVGHVCSCRADATSGAPNICVQGNCIVDSDCGAGGYCSPSVDYNAINTGIVGYYCHTPVDVCVNDTDCMATGPVACAYDSDTAHWACSSREFLPP